MLTETHYSNFLQENRDYLTDAKEEQHRLIAETDKNAAELSGQELVAYLTTRNHEMVAEMRDRTMKEIGNFVKQGLQLSKLTFDMDANL